MSPAISLLALSCTLYGCSTIEPRSNRIHIAGPTPMRCTGPSMEATKYFYAPPETIVVVPVAFTAEAIPVGTVICTYWEGRGAQVVHRVVRHRFDRDGRLAALVTRGDGNDRDDPHVTTVDRFDGIVIRQPRS